MARTVLDARPSRLATCRAAALSHACPTASSNRLLKGALLGSCSTFSAFTPQSGHRTRYRSSTTVVGYSKQAKSRTSRSSTSRISLTRRPQPEHTILRLPGLRRTPQLQRLGGLVDLRSVDSVTRPPQNLRPVVVSQTAESIEKPASLKTPSNRTLCQIPVQSRNSELKATSRPNRKGPKLNRFRRRAERTRPAGH